MRPVTTPIFLIIFLLIDSTFSVSAQLTKQWEHHYASQADSNFVYSLNTDIHGDKLQFDAAVIIRRVKKFHKSTKKPPKGGS